MIEHDGKFYLYVTFVKPGDKMGTYVLVADRPEGPFRFTEGKGLFVSGEEVDSPAIIDDIDGEPFIDDDGTGYIFGVVGMRHVFLLTGFIWMGNR